MGLKLNDTGLDVHDLQTLLNRAGFQVVADSWFGEQTEAAVKAAQAKFGLVVDGVAGPKTLQALRGESTDKLLKEADLVAAAKELGVSLAAVKAVNAVESRGHGFDQQGRPVILFERHCMFRALAALGLDAVELSAKFPNLVNPKRGGYGGGAVEWHRFNNAAQLNESAAIESASWGAFQIMGHHWQPLGYESAAAFRAAMSRSERDQLDAFVRLIKSDAALLKALKKQDWAAFAKGYNGPAFRGSPATLDDDYDLKLARAYARFNTATKPATQAEEVAA